MLWFEVPVMDAISKIKCISFKKCRNICDMVVLTKYYLGVMV